MIRTFINAIRAFIRRFLRAEQEPPGPNCFDVWLELPKTLHDYAITIPTRRIAEYGSFITIPGFFRQYLIADAEIVKHILVTNSANFIKSGVPFKRIKFVFGNSVITTEDKLWETSKNAITTINQDSYYLNMQKVINNAVDHWQQLAKKNNGINFSQEMDDICIKIASLYLFNASLGNQEQYVQKKIAFLINYLDIGFHPKLPSPTSFRFHWSQYSLNQIIDSLLNRQEHKLSTANCIAAALLQNAQLPRKYVSNNIKTLFILHYEIIRNVLSWLCYCLALYPIWQDNIQNELCTTINQEPITPAACDNLTTLNAVISEVLRLYPPFWHISRSSLEPDCIKSFVLPGKATVDINLYCLHRSPDYWNEANAFYPERFLSQDQSHIQPYSYLPFGAGIHTCYAKEIALRQIKFIAANILMRFRLEYSAKSIVEPIPKLFLQPEKPVWVKLLPI